MIIKCLYGIEDVYRNVTDIVKEKFMKEDIIEIPQYTVFNDYFKDVVKNELKTLTIYINDKKILISEDDILKRSYKIDKDGNVYVKENNINNNKLDNISIMNDNRVLYFENNQVIMKDESHLIGTKFEDIPLEFKIKFETYWKNRISNIKKLENGNYELEGLEFPNNIRSQHQKLDIFSETYMNYMTEEFYLAHLWHKFAEEKDILYTIWAGNLVGYYRGDDHIIWDDDFDIILREKDWDTLDQLWNNSKEKLFYYPVRGWDITCWQYKKVIFNNVDVILIKYTNEKKRYPESWGQWYKIKLNNRISLYNVDIGGIDLNMCSKKDGRYISTLDSNIYPIDFPKNNSLYDDAPITKYGPIKLRIVNKLIGERTLDGTYGNNWRDKKHPSLLKYRIQPSYKIDYKTTELKNKYLDKSDDTNLVLFGTMKYNKLIDITNQFIKLFIHNNTLYIPKNTDFSKIFDNIFPEINKEVYIKYNKNNIIYSNQDLYNDIHFEF